MHGLWHGKNPDKHLLNESNETILGISENLTGPNETIFGTSENQTGRNPCEFRK